MAEKAAEKAGNKFNVAFSIPGSHEIRSGENGELIWSTEIRISANTLVHALHKKTKQASEFQARAIQAETELNMLKNELKTEAKAVHLTYIGRLEDAVKNWKTKYDAIEKNAQLLEISQKSLKNQLSCISQSLESKNQEITTLKALISKMDTKYGVKTDESNTMPTPSTKSIGSFPQTLIASEGSSGTGFIKVENKVPTVAPLLSSMDALRPARIPTQFVCLFGLCTPATYQLLTREYYMNVENEVAAEVQKVLVRAGGSILSGPYTVKGHVVVELNEANVAEKVRTHFAGRAYKGTAIKATFLTEAGYATLTLSLKRKYMRTSFNLYVRTNFIK